MCRYRTSNLCSQRSRPGVFWLIARELLDRAGASWLASLTSTSKLSFLHILLFISEYFQLKLKHTAALSAAHDCMCFLSLFLKIIISINSTYKLTSTSLYKLLEDNKGWKLSFTWEDKPRGARPDRAPGGQLVDRVPGPSKTCRAESQETKQAEVQHPDH